ncbi:MAG: response regulator [Acidobacteriota bacterium]
MSLILVADDHPLNRYFLSTLLSYYGHEVIEAADGVEALQAARRRRPDLVIIDVVMPRMDGPELVRALRADPDLAGIPLIFYTASYREQESREIARQAGVDHVIIKPADPDAVLETVQRALGGRRPRPRRVSRGRAAEYVERLQIAGIRMSALMELTLDLSAERDPQQLIRTAAGALRKIFATDFVVVAIGESWTSDGNVDESRLGALRARMAANAGPVAAHAAGAREPLVAAARAVMPATVAALYLPMMTRDNLYGWILLGRSSGSPFSADDERLALAAASQIRAEHESLRAGQAERRRIEGELSAYRNDLAALVEASPVSIIAFDRDRIIRSWNAAAERIFGWRAAEVIGRPNPTVPGELAAGFERLIEQCLAGTSVTDVEQQGIRNDGARIDVSVSMAPLHDAQGVLSGLVSIVTDVTDVRASRERLRALSARVLSIQEDERTHLAREIHDNLGQLLTALKIDVSRLAQMSAAGEPAPPRLVAGLLPLIDSTMETMVRIVSELRPSRIGEMGLAAAIEKRVADFQARTGIMCTLSCPVKLNFRDDVAIAMYRILEEALTNVARHSGAARAEVRLARKGAQVVLKVRDYGRGIRDADGLAAGAYGLIGMKERALILGGTVEISGAKGRGTTITARIPLGENPSLDR